MSLLPRTTLHSDSEQVLPPPTESGVEARPPEMAPGPELIEALNLMLKIRVTF
jgi:hypothetical protein